MLAKARKSEKNIHKRIIYEKFREPIVTGLGHFDKTPNSSSNCMGYIIYELLDFLKNIELI